jgi:beta-phosphoglucomutase-like phosphatase (HAD superfamily)
LGVDAAHCLVVEDTPVGVQAGVAAGATVWGYAPQGVHAQGLLDAGAVKVMRGMGELVGVGLAAY